jgi:phosphonate ABC transporter permease subunit PhnE
MNTNKPSLLKSLGTGLAVIIIIIVFAYGVQVTDVNFETTRSEDRLTQLRRVLRALAKPDIVEYETEETDVEVPFYLPCPEGQEVQLPDPDLDGPYLAPEVPCADAKEIIEIEGYNFLPNSRGPLNFITASGVKKQLDNFQSDANGYFKLEVEIPNRQPVAEAQHIRATTRVSVGSPMLTRTAKATWAKIIETVFIALLATTIGTLISIPVSFIAARNLMSANKSPLTNVSLSLIGWPVGIWLGVQVAGVIINLLSGLPGGFIYPLVGIILGSGLIMAFIWWGMPAIGKVKSASIRNSLRALMILLSASIGIAVIILFGNLMRTVGASLVEPLASFGFLGNFIFQLGETAAILTTPLTAVIVGAVIGSVLSNIGQSISDNLSAGLVKTLNVIFTTIAGAITLAILGAIVNWFYQINNPVRTLYWPAGIGAFLGLILALWAPAKNALPTGMVIYFITRTFLNATRSIEPLVMAIVFVIWVGIGPFAGSLALALHTIAALAKLYSEQVESILPGPLEAVTATGANRLQTIVYAVVPQIIPPYISFTMYRWDINVRMSTIIGFVGGGGIGFLLQQNINLLNYRAASVQMLAIAVVVAIMDYVSSQIRERIV